MPVQTRSQYDVNHIIQMLQTPNLTLDQINIAIKNQKTALKQNANSNTFDQILNNLTTLKLIQNLFNIDHTYQYHLDYIYQNTDIIDNDIKTFTTNYFKFIHNLNLNLIIHTPPPIQLKQIELFYEFTNFPIIKLNLLKLVRQHLKANIDANTAQYLDVLIQSYQKKTNPHQTPIINSCFSDLATLFKTGLFHENESRKIYQIYRNQNFNQIRRYPHRYFNSINESYADIYIHDQTNRYVGLNFIGSLNHLKYLQRKYLLKWWVEHNHSNSAEQIAILDGLYVRNLITKKQYALIYNAIYQLQIKHHHHPFYTYQINNNVYNQNENLYYIKPILNIFKIKKPFI